VSEEVKAAAEWVDAQVPPNSSVLVHDAGAISEFAHHPAIDLVGLKTPPGRFGYTVYRIDRTPQRRDR
jgi:hypothetical protein